jgi:hypothetical protein
VGERVTETHALLLQPNIYGFRLGSDAGDSVNLSS